MAERAFSVASGCAIGLDKTGGPLHRGVCSSDLISEEGDAIDVATDPTAAAKAIVEAYLESSMVPDPEGAAAYVSADLRLTFTGGRRFSAPSDATAFNAKRYAWVKKRFLRTDAALDAETGDVHVYNTGYLYGAWKDGTTFETNRYMDKFVVRGGKIISTDVWNDSAEILLHKAGLAEADL